MTYVLGVDAGGSKTHAVVAEASGRLLGFGAAGCGNYEGVGVPAAMEAIAAACSRARERAGLQSEAVEVGCFCLAGADFPEDFAMLEREVGALGLARRVVIKNDTYAALRSGTRRPYGVVVIMGSGFNAAAVDPQGGEHRLAGEGYLYGDWGGAGDIGAEIMHRVARAYDGRGEATALSGMLLSFLGAQDVPELTRRLNQGELEGGALHETTPLVFEAACRGDRVACEIVRKVGEETAVAATAMLRRGGMEGLEVDVVLGGGVYRGKGPLLCDVVSAGVHMVNPLASIVVPSTLPVTGAVLAATEMAGERAVDRVWGNVESTYMTVVAAQESQR